MNALEMARTAYTSNAAPIRTERGTEYETVAKVTRDLRQTIETRSTDFPGFVEALHRNRKLWTILASDVADQGNGLPQELRARIFYLAEFTLHHTQLVLRKKAEPDVLVEINAAILQGLRRGEAVAGQAAP